MGQGGKPTSPEACGASKHRGRTLSIKMTQAPLSLRRRESEGTFSYLPTEEPLSCYLPPATKLSTFGLHDSQQALLSQIRLINTKLGREANACIRAVPDPQHVTPSRIPKSEVSPQGFRRVERVESKPAMLYIKSIPVNSASRSKPQSLSPSQRVEAERRELSRRNRMTSSERSLLKASIERKSQAVRERVEQHTSRDLQKLNKLMIFPHLVNEVRVQSLINVKMHREFLSSLRETTFKEKEKVMEHRGKVDTKPEVVILSAEELERIAAEERKQLVSELEGKLVDKIAKAEKNIKKEEEEAIGKITSEEIDVKLSRMMIESKKRHPILQKMKHMPIAEMNKGNKRP